MNESFRAKGGSKVFGRVVRFGVCKAALDFVFLPEAAVVLFRAGVMTSLLEGMLFRAVDWTGGCGLILAVMRRKQDKPLVIC